MYTSHAEQYDMTWYMLVILLDYRGNTVSRIGFGSYANLVDDVLIVLTIPASSNQQI